MSKQHEIRELEKQISELWGEANKTTNNNDFQKFMNKIGEKRKKLAELEK